MYIIHIFMSKINNECFHQQFLIDNYFYILSITMFYYLIKLFFNGFNGFNGFSLLMKGDKSLPGFWD